jgi:hypothetical protein
MRGCAPPLGHVLLAFTLLSACPLRADSPPAGSAGAARFGLTFSNNTFQPLDHRTEHPVPPGLYARVGLCWLPGNRLELELFQVPRLVPEPYSEAFTGLSAGCWLFRRKLASYFNMTADLSFLYGLQGRKLVAARICPIVLAGPYYRYADRLLAVALVWDPEGARLFAQLQLVGLSLFF